MGKSSTLLDEAYKTYVKSQLEFMGHKNKSSNKNLKNYVNLFSRFLPKNKTMF